MTHDIEYYIGIVYGYVMSKDAPSDVLDAVTEIRNHCRRSKGDANTE